MRSEACHALATLVLLSGTVSAQFTEEALARGVDYFVAPSQNSGSGVALCDLDGDHDLDLVVLGRIDGQIGVYENDGLGHFTDRSLASGLAPIPFSSASGVVAADYDGDGLVDLFFSNASQQDRLVRNLGNLVFQDVTEEAGVGSWGWGSGCTFGDYDGDGYLDLHLATKSTFANPRESILFHNEGDGTFVEDRNAGLTHQDVQTWQSIFVDYDLDGDQDLYISNDKGEMGTERHNRMWKNVGGTFVDVTEETGTAAYADSMGVAVGDVDRNGYPDLYCTNIGPNRLFMNYDGVFADLAPQAGVTSDSTGWGALFFDFDRDRSLELHVCNANDYDRFYTFGDSWPCPDLARDEALDFPSLSFCTAVGDIDEDGDLDLVHSAMVDPIRLFMNREVNNGHWIKIVLRGNAPNTRAVGARVEVVTNSGTLTQQVHAGIGYKSSSPFQLYFGVGSDVMIRELRVHWPDGAETVSEGLPVDRKILVRQRGLLRPEVLQLR